MVKQFPLYLAHIASPDCHLLVTHIVPHASVYVSVFRTRLWASSRKGAHSVQVCLAHLLSKWLMGEVKRE